MLFLSVFFFVCAVVVEGYSVEWCVLFVLEVQNE